MPARQESTDSPAAVSAAVLPPVLGPVITTARTPFGRSTSIGTGAGGMGSAGGERLLSTPCDPLRGPASLRRDLAACALPLRCAATSNGCLDVRLDYGDQCIGHGTPGCRAMPAFATTSMLTRGTSGPPAVHRDQWQVCTLTPESPQLQGGGEADQARYMAINPPTKALLCHSCVQLHKLGGGGEGDRAVLDGVCAPQALMPGGDMDSP